jgi:hypothetical protein
MSLRLRFRVTELLQIVYRMLTTLSAAFGFNGTRGTPGETALLKLGRRAMFIWRNEGRVTNHLRSFVRLACIGIITIGIACITVAQENAPQSSRQSGPNQRAEGQVPPNWRPGTGTIITGEDADKAKAAAMAKYPGGIVNRVLKLSDGSYAVHMIKIRWPHHVFVSKEFQVIGAIG